MIIRFKALGQCDNRYITDNGNSVLDRSRLYIKLSVLFEGIPGFGQRIQKNIETNELHVDQSVWV